MREYCIALHCTALQIEHHKDRTCLELSLMCCALFLFLFLLLVLESIGANCLFNILV